MKEIITQFWEEIKAAKLITPREQTSTQHQLAHNLLVDAIRDKIWPGYRLANEATHKLLNDDDKIEFTATEARYIEMYHTELSVKYRTHWETVKTAYKKEITRVKHGTTIKRGVILAGCLIFCCLCILGYQQYKSIENRTYAGGLNTYVTENIDYLGSLFDNKPKTYEELEYIKVKTPEDLEIAASLTDTSSTYDYYLKTEEHFEEFYVKTRLLFDTLITLRKQLSSVRQTITTLTDSFKVDIERLRAENGILTNDTIYKVKEIARLKRLVEDHKEEVNDITQRLNNALVAIKQVNNNASKGELERVKAERTEFKRKFEQEESNCQNAQREFERFRGLYKRADTIAVKPMNKLIIDWKNKGFTIEELQSVINKMNKKDQESFMRLISLFQLLDEKLDRPIIRLKTN